MIQCYNSNCPYKNQITGDCTVTACIQSVSTTIEPNRIEFPHTIGNTTFYTNDELIGWVIKQQRKNRELLNVLLKED